jgi:hypothetical protein
MRVFPARILWYTRPPMGDPLRDRRVPVAPPAAGPGGSAHGVDLAHAVFGPRASKAAHPPTTVPPSPRTLGPRRATPTGGEYLIVPRRRS